MSSALGPTRLGRAGDDIGSELGHLCLDVGRYFRGEVVMPAVDAARQEWETMRARERHFF